jgi:hypothetical protein
MKPGTSRIRPPDRHAVTCSPTPPSFAAQTGRRCQIPSSTWMSSSATRPCMQRERVDGGLRGKSASGHQPIGVHSIRNSMLTSQRSRNWPRTYATHRLGYDYRRERDTVAGHHDLPSANRCGLAFRSSAIAARVTPAARSRRARICASSLSGVAGRPRSTSACASLLSHEAIARPSPGRRFIVPPERTSSSVRRRVQPRRSHSALMALRWASRPSPLRHWSLVLTRT